MEAYQKKRRYRFSGVYTCGHEGTEYTYTKDYAEDIFQNSKCPDCRKKDWLNEQEKVNNENSQKSAELNLISLIGTEKQVTWANTIRIKFLNKIEESINELKQSDDPIRKNPYFSLFKQFILDNKDIYSQGDIHLYKYSDYVNVDSYFSLLADVKNKILSQERADYFINFKEYDRDIRLLINLFGPTHSNRLGYSELDLTKFLVNKE